MRSATRRDTALTIAVDHDTGRLIWAAVGKSKQTLKGFFDLVGEERCKQIRLVSADAAEWIADVVHERCDPFITRWMPLGTQGHRRARLSAIRHPRNAAFLPPSPALLTKTHQPHRRPARTRKRRKARLRRAQAASGLREGGPISP
jgi:transposase